MTCRDCRAPAPPLYYVLLGKYGLAVADPAWAVLLRQDVSTGTR